MRTKHASLPRILPLIHSMTCRPRAASLLVVTLLVATATARADLIASDDFEYESTLIRGCNGGTGWADAWTGGNLVTVGSLQYQDRDTRGHKLTTNGGTVDSIRCSFRTLRTAGREDLLVDGSFGKPGTTVWVGFLANVPTGRNGGFGGISLVNNRREQLFFGDTGRYVFWGIEVSKDMQIVSTMTSRRH